jgi:hypothetical protein
MKDAEQLIIAGFENGERIRPFQLRSGEDPIGQLVPIHYGASSREVCRMQVTGLGSR